MTEEIHPDELDSTRAALEPTLRAVADILPLVAQARESRFPPELATRWEEICQRLRQNWSNRHSDGLLDFRPVVFELCALAVELNDSDCLHFSEALATATDRLEDPIYQDAPQLIAALSAACECLVDDNSLEHPLFSERIRYLAHRLEHCSHPGSAAGHPNPTLERIFVGEVQERLEAMREALELLPPDAYAIKSAAEEIVHLAEPLELYDIIDRARLLIIRLTPAPGENLDLDIPETRDHVLDRIALLETAITEIADAL